MKKRRVHIVLATVLFGILLWLSVNLREQYQVTLSAPLVIDDIPQGMAVRTPVPHAVQFKVRGDGWRLASLLMGPDISLTIRLGSFPQGSSTITITDLPDRLGFSQNLHLVSLTPDTLTIGLGRYGERKVPVVLDCTFDFREGYSQVGEAIVTPESVTVSGAESVIARVATWKTSAMVLHDVRAPVETTVPLASRQDFLLAVAPQAVQVKLMVEPIAEKTFASLTVDVRSVPKDRDVILIPPKVDVVARGGIEQLANLIPSDFRVTVEYSRVVADSSGLIEPAVTGPPGVQIVLKKPEKLQYILRKRL